MGFKFNPFTGNLDVVDFPPNGVVSSAGSSTDNAVVRFDGTTGAQIQNSGVIIDDSNNVLIPGTVTAGQVIDSGLTANTVPYANGSKQLTSSAVTPTELGYVSGVTSSIQTQLNGKQPTGNYITDLTGDVTATGPGSAVATISNLAVTNAKIANSTIDLTTKVTGILPIANGGTNSNTTLNNNRVMQSSGGTIVEAAAITANRALISDSNGIPTNSVTTATELTYVSGVTSSIQTQLNSKQSTTLTNAHILVGDGSNLAADVAVSGDVTITNTGNVQITAGVIVDADINASAAIDASKIANGSVSNTEYQYLDGVTSSIQTQLDNRLLKAAGDINETSFTAADNQVAAANITGLAFANGTVRSFEALVSITRGATYQQFKLNGVQRAADWAMNQSYVGDDAGLVLTITTAGQIQYVSSSTGSTALLKFRAITTGI